MGPQMKKPALVLIAWLLAANPASACTEWASYGTFTLGSFGYGNDVVGGEEIGGTHSRFTSQDQWNSTVEHLISDCAHYADFNAMRGANRWPDDTVEIRRFFREQQRECIDYFVSVHAKFTSDFCQ